MAKKIRFPLEMDNGVAARNMVELREHFSLAKVLEYFENGKLAVWLRDHYENNIADAVEALGKDEQDLVKKLSEIFDVPYDEDTEEELEKAAERAERLKRLKEYTDEERFWDKVDNVAFEQDELYDLLDEDAETIYLCGERFSIPLSKSGVQYIGVNNPTVVVDSKVLVDWEKKGISLEGVVFDDKYQKIVNENSQEFISMDVPDSDSSNTGFKSYMDYRAITDKRSDQYQLQQEATTDENGFRVYDDCKMIALGTYYVDKIGDKFRITLEDDTVFYAIAGDVKSDLHTDTKHQHKNGNIVEFIVDTQEISKTCKKMGDMSYAGLNGKIKSIIELLGDKEDLE